MRKAFISTAVCLGMTVFISMSISAQTTFSEFNNYPGMYVMYETSNGELLSLLYGGNNGYYARLYSKSSETLFTAIIKKDFADTNISILEIARQGDSDQLDRLKMIISNMFVYTGMNQSKKLPSAYVSTKKDLSGNIIRQGYVDFFIPITNLLKETDKDGNITLKCVEFGYIKEDGLARVMNFSKYPDFKNREMNPIKSRKWLKTAFGSFSIEIPDNWQLSDNYYFVKDATTRDAVLLTKNVSCEGYGVADIYGIIIMELNNLGAYIIPESISYTITQDKATLQFDFVDYTYGEYNKRIMAFYTKNNKTYDVLQISGYKDFIDKNKDMIDRILKSAKVK